VLLSRFVRRRLANSNDSGIALPAVIGVMAVGLLLTALIASSVVSGLGHTTAARADVQSQANADAGVAAARVGLEMGTCATKLGVYVNSAAEATAGILYRAIITVPNAGAWATPPVAGCPANASVPVRIVSTGTAAAGGTSGQTAGNTSFVEAIYTPAPSIPISGSGAAVYAYSATSFGGAGQLSSVNGSSPSVMVKTGDVACSGVSSGVDDWVVAAGTMTFSGTCSSNGDVFVSGRVTVTGTTQLGGNVVAAGLTLGGTGSVGGSVWSTSDIQLPGTAGVAGNVTAASLTMGGTSRITGSAWVYGATSMNGVTSIGGKLTTKTKTGTSTSYGSIDLVPGGPGASPYVTPTAPIVPAWVDFSYTKSDWVGFTEVVLPSTGCSTQNLKDALISIGTSPGILDARLCTSGIVLGGIDQLTLRNDLAIVANKFDLGGVAGITSAAAARLWLITPESIIPATNTTNHLPDCPAGGTFSIAGTFAIASTISTMIYSPCLVDLAGTSTLRGQVYARNAEIDGVAKLAYVQVGLPGVDLTLGTNSGGAATGPRTLTSYRNVQSGG
jgi:cytoskeletal protein CcmA (bactofilin family)